MFVLEFAGEDDDLAALEAASACVGVERLAPGLATARSASERVRGLAYTRRVSTVIGTCTPTVDATVGLLEDADLARSGTVAVAARDVRGRADVPTQPAERALGDELVERGFTVDLEDPDHELRALFAPETAVLGWLEAESLRDYGTRAPAERPYVQPGSMAPMLARALVNIAGARPGQRVLDPMCGTGGLLLEAALVGASVVGTDVQARMVRGTRENLERYLRGPSSRGTPVGGYRLARADAARLPVQSDGMDAVVFDAPYGRQSPAKHASLDGLVGDALREARRVAARGVLVADRPRTDTAEEAGWTVQERLERPVHRSLVRHVHVLV